MSTIGLLSYGGKSRAEVVFSDLLCRFDNKKPEQVREILDKVAIDNMSTYYNMLLPQEVLKSHFSIIYTEAVLLQGNRAMRCVFPISNDSLIVICFRTQKVKAVIASA